MIQFDTVTLVINIRTTLRTLMIVIPSMLLFGHIIIATRHVHLSVGAPSKSRRGVKIRWT